MLICKKRALLVMLFSLALGAANFLAAPGLLPQEPEGAFAELSLDADYAEWELLDGLAAAGIGPVIAESTQEVFLDEFGELVSLPLEAFFQRVEPFDPRNDGYAGRLRSFFVRDGRRYLYLPASSGLRARIAPVLGDVPYSLVPAHRGWSSAWYLLFFVLGAAGAFLLAGPSLTALAVIPPLSGLAFAGPPGLALAAALFGLFGTLRASLAESPSFRGPGGIYRRGFSVSCALLFMLLCAWVWRRWAIPFQTGLRGVLSFCAVFAAALMAEFSMEKERGRAKFAPVSIRAGLPGRERVSGLFITPRCAAPLALAAAGALLVPPLFGGGPAGEPFAGLGEDFPLISAAEYEAHAAFQASFSYRSLHEGDAESPVPYQRYALAEDGLIAAVPLEAVYAEDVYVESLPPFPLEALMSFIGRSGQERTAPGGFLTEQGRLLALVMGVLSAWALFPRFRRRKSGKPGMPAVYQDKQAAA